MSIKATVASYIIFKSLSQELHFIFEQQTKPTMGQEDICVMLEQN